MAIKFIPPLNWTTRIPGGVPRAGNHDASSGDAMRVRFTATMAEKDYAEVQRTGMRFELWTNAPAGGGGGEWHAHPFEEDRIRESGAEADENLDGDILDLGDGFQVADEEGTFTSTDPPSPSSPTTTSNAPGVAPRMYTFSKTLALPCTSHQKYAFTYRIVKPSGIRWVGTDNTNGVLHVVPQDGCVLEQGEWTWVRNEGAGDEWAWLRSYATAEGAQGDFVIANFDLRDKKWVGWGIGRDASGKTEFLHRIGSENVDSRSCHTRQSVKLWFGSLQSAR